MPSIAMPGLTFRISDYETAYLRNLCVKQHFCIFAHLFSVRAKSTESTVGA